MFFEKCREIRIHNAKTLEQTTFAEYTSESVGITDSNI
jgi:hypothetical protein